MSNPLSHIGQTAHPEVSLQVQQHCEQARTQQQGDQVQSQAQGEPARQDSAAPWEPPATRLPQHPKQQQENPAQRANGQQRIRQQGETRAEDTALPSPTDAD